MPVGFWPFKTIGSIENTVIVVVHLIYVTRVFFDRKKKYLCTLCCKCLGSFAFL